MAQDRDSEPLDFEEESWWPVEKRHPNYIEQERNLETFKREYLCDFTISEERD